ncbi:phoenix [Danio aesculapii]|uniref:phoenix n=1 Tax=Danio aesculapii TaxID=1142201 RepID=UPI0024C0852C|nr:phoenix [Danio aesculapii]
MRLRSKGDVPVGELMEADSRAELIFETPPPDVVSSINACFDEIDSTLKKRRDASVDNHPSDSDSESLFITQSVTKAVHTKRRPQSSKKPSSISDDSGYVRERRLSENQQTEFEGESRSQPSSCRRKSRWELYAPARKATFPFLMKSLKKQHLPIRKHQILENSEVGGFFKCIKKIKTDSVKMGKEINPKLFQSPISDSSEEEDQNSEHDVKSVDKALFVSGSSRGISLNWLPDFISKRRTLENHLSNGIDKEKKIKQIAEDESRNRYLRKVKALSKSSQVSEKPEKQVTHEVLASCSDHEDLEIVECAENLHEDHKMVIEETQRHTVEEASAHLEHKDALNCKNQPDVDQPNESNFICPPQGGDISTRSDIQQTDSDIGSDDLFSPFNSPKRDNQIPNTTSITANVEESHQDSDVTQIESEGQNVSTFTQETQKCFANEEYDSDETHIDTESLSKLEPRTPNKPFTSTKHPEIPKLRVQSPKLPSRQAETVNVEISPKHLPLSNVPLSEVNSSSFETAIVGQQKPMVETETDSPMFTNTGLSFLKRKRKRTKDKNDKNAAADFKQHDTSRDVGQIVSCECPGDDITGLKTTPIENIEACGVEHEMAIGEQTKRLGLQSKELLEKSALSTVNSVSTKIKRDKMTKHKVKDCEDTEPAVENQSVETFETELTHKKANKKKKDKDRLTKSYPEENVTNIQSNEALDSAELRVKGVTQSSQSLNTDQPTYVQEITGATELNKKKKRHKTDDPLYESVGLDVTSASQFDVGFRIDEQQEGLVTEEGKTDEHLQGKTLKVAKGEKKIQNASFQVDHVIGLDKQRSDSGAKPANLDSYGLESLTAKKKKKKKHKLKEKTDPKLDFDIDNNVQLFQSDELQTTDSVFSDSTHTNKRKKKKLKCQNDTDQSSDLKQLHTVDNKLQTIDLPKTNKHMERTGASSSDALLEHMDDRPPGMRENNTIRNDQIEHLQTSEDVTRCSSPRLSSDKKREETSVDPNLDESSVFQFDGLDKAANEERTTTQNATKEKQSDEISSEHLENSPASSPSQVENIANVNSSVLLDHTLINKLREGQLKGQTYKELALAFGLKQLCIVVNKLKTTDLPKTNKNIKGTGVGSSDELLKHTDDRPLEMRLNNTIQTNQIEHLQTSEDVIRRSSPSVTRLSSTKKWMKTSIVSNLDASSGSKFDGWKNASKEDRTTPQNSIEGKQSDAISSEGLENNPAHLVSTHKSEDASPSSQVDNVVGLQSDANSVLLDHTHSGKRKKKKKKKHKLIEQTDTELTLEIDDNVQAFQSIELQTMDLPSKRTTNKKHKDRERTGVSLSDAVLKHIDDGPSEMRENNTIQTNKIRHLQTLEEMTRCSSPRLSSEKKTKKKSVDPNLDVSSGSQFDGSNGTAKEYSKNSTDVSSSDSMHTSKQKKKKQQKLKEQENVESGGDNVHSGELDQFSELQITELTTKTKKKKDKKRTKQANVEENGVKEILSNEAFKASQTDQPEHIQTSEEITQDQSPNVAASKLAKKKKRKTNKTKDPQCESIDLDLSSATEERTTIQHQTEETQGDDNAAELLEINLAGSIKVSKKKKENAGIIQLDNIVGLQSGSSTDVNSSELSDSTHKHKKKKRKKLKEQENVEANADDVHSVEPDQFGGLQITKMTTKKKHKSCEEESGLKYISSNEAFKAPPTNQLEHIATSKEITLCQSPNVAALKSAKKKRNETPQCLDASSVSQFDDVKKRAKADQTLAQNSSEEMQSADISSEGLEINPARLIKVSKKKRENGGSPNQVDNIIGLQSGNSIDVNSSELLDSTCTDKQKRKKLKEHENVDADVENVNTAETDQFSGLQITEPTTKKKKKHKRCAEESGLKDISSNEAFKAPLTNQLEHIQISEEITRCQSPNVATLKSVKKKKKKRDETEESQCLVGSVSQFDDVKKQAKEDQTLTQNSSEETQGDDNAVECLEMNPAGSMKVSKKKKKRENAGSPYKVDNIVGLQSGNSADVSSSVLSDSTDTNKHKKKKRKKLKEQEIVEADVDNVHSPELDQFSGLQITEMTTKKKKKHKRCAEESGLKDISSNEAFKAPPTNQLKHKATSEEMTQYHSLNVATLKSATKKMDETKEPQCLVGSVSQFDDVKKQAKVDQTLSQNSSEETQGDDNAVECLEMNPAGLKVSKKKRENAGSPYKVDNIIGLQSGNSADVNSSVLSDSTDTNKHKKKKRKKLEEQENVDADVDDVHSAEPDQFSGLQITEMTTKKKKKHKRCVEESDLKDISSNEAFKAPPTNQLEHIQTSEQMTLKTVKEKKKRDATEEPHYESVDLNASPTESTTEANQLEHTATSEEITQCESPNVAALKSVKKKEKKKKHETKDPQCLDAGSVSQFDDVTRLKKRAKEDRTTTQNSSEETQNDEISSEQLEMNPAGLIKVSKKKRENGGSLYQLDNIVGLQSGNSTDISCSVLSDSTHTDKQKKKKLKKQENVDVDDVHSAAPDQFSGLQITEMTTKKKKKHKSCEEESGLKDVSSNEAFKAPLINQLEHIATSEEITQCQSPNVATLKSVKKKKKKRDETEEPQCLDASSVSQFDDVKKLAKADRTTTHNSSEETQGDDISSERLELNPAHLIKVSKRKRENKSLGLLLENTADPNSSLLSDSTCTDKHKKKKRKKLKEQENVDVDDVHSAEPDQFSGLQITEMTTKKKKKHKRCVEESGLKDISSNEAFKAPQTNQLEHIQTSEQMTFKTVKEKKKRDATEEPHYVSVDLNASPTESTTEANQLEHIATSEQMALKTVRKEKKKRDATEEPHYESVDLNASPTESSTEAKLNPTKHKKKRKQSFSGNHDANEAPEMKRKKEDRNWLSYKWRWKVLKLKSERA